MYPVNLEGTQVIVGSMIMGYISDTARDRTHNLFRPKRESIPLGHSDWLYQTSGFKIHIHIVIKICWSLQYFKMAVNLVAKSFIMYND